MKKTNLLFLTLLCTASVGCSTLAPSVDFPDEQKTSSTERKRLEAIQAERAELRSRDAEDAQYAREEAIRASGTSDGSIFNTVSYSGLFEDRRARAVGDLLTIDIQENIDSEQQNETSVSRDDDLSITTPEIRGFFNLRPIGGAVNSSKDFNGQGATRANNRVRGRVSVVVTEVLPSGNLRVKGERQIGTNREVESIKFYGIVNPETIRSGNRVSSSEVAEARIEYRGKGAIDSAQAMGWMSRVFLSIMPF